MSESKYDPKAIEGKWQRIWETAKIFEVPDVTSLPKKPKYYILDMFPYPSAAGLHVGHPEGYTATDVMARYKRMKGFNVLHPMGWDAFGLPAERAAMRENMSPAVITKRNIDNFRRQIKRLGFSYDWSREIDTSRADYYRWTQWIFLKLYERGLAYLAEVPVNFCPALGTVLANEEVKDGKYIETGDSVERRLMKQWMLKITAYAERLLGDLEDLDWPESVKQMQRHWIGKSEGADIVFKVVGRADTFTVFTTRPDTLFGATYCVLAPEHPLVETITSTDKRAAVQKYVQEASKKSELSRTDLARDKMGLFTGAFAEHPVTAKPIPIWIADYVLGSYGTGAIMAVPAHDERDHEFALAHQLPIVEVISGGEKSITEQAHVGDGTLVSSDFLNGLPVKAAKKKMGEWIVSNKRGGLRLQYRLRDWLFSRQRYWGEPFPIVYLENGTLVPLPEDALPIELPQIDEYRPTADGKPPLARAGEKWLRVKLPDGRTGIRETNTMPQWAGSCWYYLRYLDPKNDKAPWSSEAEKYWMPVDLYVGGVEHAVLHLLYARFWHKVLYDCGLVHTKEPFQKLFNQGMILAYSYRDENGKYYHSSQVEEREGGSYSKETRTPLEAQIEKMSKSKMNIVNPDDVIEEFGADSMRLYELFMGPLEQVKPWKMDGVEGVYRFLGRVWRLMIDEKTGKTSSRMTGAPGRSEMALWRTLHKTIKKVTQDTEGMQFNTAISQMMIFVNEAYHAKTMPNETALLLLRVLAPYAPHLCEELWERMAQKELIAKAGWPEYEESLCEQDRVTIVVQINGKVRDKVEALRGVDRASLEKLVLQSPKVMAHLQGKAPKQIFVVPDRLVNLVV